MTIKPSNDSKSSLSIGESIDNMKALIMPHLANALDAIKDGASSAEIIDTDHTANGDNWIICLRIMQGLAELRLGLIIEKVANVSVRGCATSGSLQVYYDNDVRVLPDGMPEDDTWYVSLVDKLQRNIMSQSFTIRPGKTQP